MLIWIRELEARRYKFLRHVARSRADAFDRARAVGRAYLPCWSAPFFPSQVPFSPPSDDHSPPES